jgi:glutamate decarboxylase
MKGERLIWSRHHMAMRRRSTLVTPIFSNKKKENNPFADEEHSLKGKTGKTHAVC